ncbi:MAG: zinc metalloprotease [Actinomycetota bacterium]
MPPRRKCGAMQVHERLAETYATFRANQDQIQRFTERSVLTGEAQRVLRRRITIPVVVHVVYRTDRENISKAQINSQIAVLNRDFRARNPDKSKVPDIWKGLVANANITFALATKNPKGGSTTGVTRTKTNQRSFAADDSVKSVRAGGVAAWPTNRYLNVWVCNLGEQLLGYAQFPGGPARTDGVVILHSAFGTSGTAASPFNRGRTTTHEIGHWLNLRHIWGDTIDCSGTDFVADTPTAQMPNYGKPSFPHLSCNNGPNGDMFMNYMDYVDDAAMLMFTVGQATRMNACLAGPRKKLGL